MASPSGNSSSNTTTSPPQNSGSEGELQSLKDQRKRKRMESNRESARRSRMRKQKHLDDLMAQVSQLMKENNQILTGITVTTQHLLDTEAENSVLRAQVMELSQRLNSLNEIINFIYSANGVSQAHHGLLDMSSSSASSDGFMSPMDLGYLMNQPIAAATDAVLQY